jgi:hypothetical protein
MRVNFSKTLCSVALYGEVPGPEITTSPKVAVWGRFVTQKENVACISAGDISI